MIKKYLIYSICGVIICLLIACNKNEPAPTPLTPSCDRSMHPIGDFMYCDEFTNSAEFCTENPGEYVTLQSTESLRYLPLLCDNVTGIVLKNSAGEEVTFQIKELTHEVYPRTRDIPERLCTTDSTYKMQSCEAFEQVIIDIESEEEEWRLMLTPADYWPNPNQSVEDRFSLSRVTEDTVVIIRDPNDFNVILDTVPIRGNVYESLLAFEIGVIPVENGFPEWGLKFEELVTLHDLTFRDVYIQGDSGFSALQSDYTVYYNQQMGIVAFQKGSDPADLFVFSHFL